MQLSSWEVCNCREWSRRRFHRIILDAARASEEFFFLLFWPPDIDFWADPQPMIRGTPILCHFNLRPKKSFLTSQEPFYDKWRNRLDAELRKTEISRFRSLFTIFLVLVLFQHFRTPNLSSQEMSQGFCPQYYRQMLKNRLCRPFWSSQSAYFGPFWTKED